MSVLDISFVSDDLGEEVTLRKYLKEILCRLWRQGDQFSGEMPFGYSGWQFAIYAAMIKEGLIDGKLDEYGEVEKGNLREADKIIIDAIIEEM